MADRSVGGDGGMWNLPRTNISHDTKNLLQSMSTTVSSNNIRCPKLQFIHTKWIFCRLPVEYVESRFYIGCGYIYVVEVFNCN